MKVLIGSFIVVVLAYSCFLGYQLKEQKLEITLKRVTPVPFVTEDKAWLNPGPLPALIQIGAYSDEVVSYLMYDYIRSQTRSEVLLAHYESPSGPEYWLLMGETNDLAAGLAEAARLQATGYISSFDWFQVHPKVLYAYRSQSRVFEAAYNWPGRPRLERLTPNQLFAYTKRFVTFKSATDPRIRKRIEPVPEALSSDDATRLAADIIIVADFFELPLDLFLGIGAMENNYMNVRGDLENTKWKRRPEKGDIVIRRRKGRVLVLNDSAGVWQITRETLRYVHRLYLKDERDYTRLPERLRPPKELDINEVDPYVLTTYAGLLFRDLLDEFDGDIGKAVGAYNGGPARPNMNYTAGVERVAVYARRVMEQAAALNGQRVAEMQFFAPRR